MKKITIYSKSGNPLEIKASLKNNFIGKGYFIQDPTNKKSKEEVEKDGK